MQDPLEGMIRGTLRRETAAAEPCPDADVLAAFHEGSLPSADRRRVEAHAADCGRCAAHLALLARTEPDAAAGSPWRRHWTWAVPLATAATVAAIWVAVPARHDVPQAPDSRGRIESAPLPGDDQRPPMAAPEPTVVAPTPAPESSPARATQTRPTASTVARKSEEARALADAPPPAGSAAAAAPGARGDLGAAAARQPAAPAERDERAPALAAERIAEDKTAAMTAAPAPPPAAPAPAAREARDNRAELERAAPQALALQQARASARLRFSSRAVERSLDGGLTWTTEALPTTVPMRVGGCAGADVCWAAGAAGAIVRRDAGGGWLVVTPPAQADIVHLEVHGPDHVTIATADGRRFETRDGGRSWHAR